jgi:hypothetical protein
MSSDYPSFGKIPRFHRDCMITEKLDGSNGLVEISRVPDGAGHVQGAGIFPVDTPEGTCLVRAGSRNRWLTPEQDNYTFSRWAGENATELVKLGEGRHYGEWFGKGIQRGYGLPDRRFALFNAARWFDPRNRDGSHFNQFLPNVEQCPEVVTVVPILSINGADILNAAVELIRGGMESTGSIAVPGFPNPEGIMVFHMAGRHFYKILFDGDNVPKGGAA